MNDRTDEQLLREFAEHRTEQEFAELVRRHVDLVYSAALRIVVDPHWAEDVSQGVFAALASDAGRVAGRVAAGVPLSGWLHNAARNQAAKLVRTEERRRAREKEASIMHESGSDPTAAWERISPLLDETLAALPENDRHALLLRFFEGQTAREIGRRTGLSEEAAQKRLSRALEKLRDAFAARGIAVEATTLGTTIAAWGVQAAPTALSGSIVQSVAASAAMTAVSSGFGAPFVARQTIIIMTKTQAALIGALAVAVAVPLAMQQLRINRLRSSMPVMPSTVPIAVAPAVEIRQADADGEARDIARLQGEINDLRSKIAARQAQLAATKPARAAGPILIELRRPAAIGDLVYAGNDTPSAALQSRLVAERDGDVDAVFGSALTSPKQYERNQLELLEAAVRTEMLAQMKDELAGVTQVELLEDKADTEYRRRLQYRLIKAGQSATNTITSGLTSEGWAEVQH